METVKRVYYRESGRGIGQTFWWDRASQTVRAEDEENRLTALGKRTLTQDDLAFMDTWMRKYDLVAWETYPESVREVLDGTDWTLEVTTNKQTIYISKSNVYPPGWRNIRDALYRFFTPQASQEGQR